MKILLYFVFCDIFVGRKIINTVLTHAKYKLFILRREKTKCLFFRNDRLFSSNILFFKSFLTLKKKQIHGGFSI